MADTPEKRHKRTFEPPPWEKERFDRLRKERETEGAEPPKEVLGERSDSTSEPGEHAERDNPPPGDVQKAAEPVERGPERVEDQADVDLMLLQLNAEEPKLHKEVWAYAAVSAIVVGIMGVALLMYSLVAAVKIKDAGTMAGWFGVVVILIFGSLMIAGAIWMGMRSARLKRGEL